MSSDKRQILNNAHKLLDRGLYDRAIKEYQRIVDMDPSDVFALQKIAELHARNGAHASAVGFYEKSYAVLKGKGFHEKCVAVLKRILELDPGQLEYRFALAQSQAELGRLEESGNTLRSLIGLYERKGERQESLRMLKELVRVLPNDWTNRTRLAEAYSSLGKNILAVETFVDVLNFLRGQENYREHDRVAERVLYLYPDQQAVGLSLSRSYLMQMKIREALTWLQVLFKTNPRHPETLELLGDAFVSQNRTDKALAVYKEARRVLHQEGRSAEAEAIREKIFSVDPDQSMSMAAPRRPISITSQKPSAVEAELPSAVLLSDALILCDFDLPDHALKRLEALVDDFVPGKANTEKILELSAYISSLKHEGLRTKIQEIAASINEPEVTESDASTSSDPGNVSGNAPVDDEKLRFAVSLEDEIDLAGLDFSEFDDDSSLLTESVLERIDTRELREDSFDFEVEGDAGGQDDDDEFADLLEGHDSSVVELEAAVITPMAPSALETKERFPRIRPLIDSQVKGSQDPDRTEEVSALIDDFTNEIDSESSEATAELSEVVAKPTSNENAAEEAEDEFGGLLEPDD